MLLQIAEAKVVEAVDIKALLAMGDLGHGEKVFKKCTACHKLQWWKKYDWSKSYGV